MTKAIILSAGQGQRLKPLTNDRPKGMVEIAGRPIIEHQLELFRKVGINKLTIVQGFCAEAIPDYGVSRYSNLDYAVSNMVYSLFCAEPELITGQVIVSYGDILYSEKVLRSLLKSSSPISVVVDLEWKSYFERRAENPYDDAESLLIGDDGLLKAIGQSHPEPADVQAQFIGLIQFDERGLSAMRELRDEIGASGASIGWGRSWSEAYMTDLLQELVQRGVPVRAVPIRGEWCEIDTLTDFEVAEERFKRFSS